MTHVLFYVQPLLGLGHEARAAAMARAMIDAGMAVTIVAGGTPGIQPETGGAHLVTLPSLRAADPRYQALVDAGGAAPDEALWRERQHRLMAAFDATRPDILLVETFPFGRWPFRRELMPLLDIARRHCRIVCSVRDLLEPKAEGSRNRRIVELIDRYFDLVLVHGDPALATLDRTFADTAAIADRLRYTGYVAPAIPAAGAGDGAGTGEIVVSAGGGATCATLMTAAAGAARRDSRRWRFLLGPNSPSDLRTRLAATRGIAVEPIRPDFRALLRRAAASISQAGYNTALDVLISQVPAVMVPFAGFGQREQVLRASLLAERGLVEMLPEDGMTPGSLLDAVARALARPAPATCGLRLDGAAETARLLVALRPAGNCPPCRI